MSKPSTPSQPISQHPMFPLVVAVWFAALFGLGSLAIRPGLLESAVLAMHLDAVVPAAAPPLGVTARILIAVVFAALGCVLGLVAGNRLAARGPKPAPRQRRGAQGELVPADDAAGLDARVVPEAGPRRPLFAHQDIDTPGIDETATETEDQPRQGRRRALSVTDETQPSQLLERAPLPGGATAEAPAPEPAEAEFVEAAPAAAIPAELFTPPPAEEVPELDWSQAAPVRADRPFDAPPPALQAALNPFTASFEPDADEADAEELPPLSPRQLFTPAPPSTAEEADDAPNAPAPFAAPARDSETEDVGEAEPFDLALEMAEDVAADPLAGLRNDPPEDGEPEPASVPQFAAPVQAASAPVASPQPAAQSAPALTAAENLASPNLDDLGMVELAERLARAMQSRRDRQAGVSPVAAAAPPQLTVPAPAPSAPPAVPVAYEPPSPELPAHDEPASELADADLASSEPLAVPAAFQPLELGAADEADDDDDDVFELPSLLASHNVTLAPARLAEPEPEPVADVPAVEEAEEDEEGAAETCGSLLDLGRAAPPRQEFVRIENEPAPAAIEPVVIFPGQAATPAAGARPFDPPGSRPFDQGGNGQAVPVPASQVDAEEAERALKAALASLQRISGAA